MTLYDQFINDVESEKLLSCEFVKLAVKRHLNDLKKSKKKSYPYYFNREKADRAIRLVKLFRHTAGRVANHRFHLAPYHTFIIANIFGWVQKKDDLRRFRRVYVEMARKSVKSELAAAIALVMLIFDHEHGAQVYTAATRKEQAKIVFLKAVSMIRKLMKESPRVMQKIQVTGKTMPTRILYSEKESYMEPLSAEHEKQDGTDIHCYIVDEYHAHKTDELLEVGKTGMGARSQPLIFVITTAGFNIEGPCYKERAVAVNLLKGIYENERLFSIIFTLDKDDDWNDPKVWIKSNPNIGNTPTWEYMYDAYQSAQEGVSKEIQFKTKNLNLWQRARATWIKDKDYEKVEQFVNIESLFGQHCVLGLDLASAESGDFVALDAFFPKNEHHDKHILYHFLFISEEKLAERRKASGVDYMQWVRDKHIITNPGNIIDYEYVKKKIYWIAENFDLKYLEIDRWNSSQLIKELIDEGLPVEKFGQGFASMSAPVKQMEYWIKKEEIIIHNNPVFRWMMGNVVVVFDPAGNVKMDKNKAQEKIDGPVAAAMAIGGYLTDPQENETYTGEGPQQL